MPACRARRRAGLKKAYFGRIDYQDRTFHMEESCYIGKNGITKNKTEVVIVDWRAPVATVYYENETGEGTYQVAGSGKTTVALHRISYLLYNYDQVYKPAEFCIVGSSDMLLNYINSGLPGPPAGQF